MIRAWLIAALLLGAGTAQAACTLDTLPINLGSYSPLGPAPSPTLVSMRATCDVPTPVQVQASEGNSMRYDIRTLSMGANQVNYNLYTGTTDTVVWGDGRPGTQVVSDTADTAGVQLVGNARIYPNQNPVPGTYTDTLIFTVVF